MKTAVIYARYSSDLQKDRSIEDQIEQAKILAKRFGYEVSATYSDKAMSGASMVDREGLLELMTAAKKRKFNAVVVESLSRLSRDEEDTAAIFKRLRFNDVKIIDQSGEVTDIHASIGGIVNSQFLKNLAVSVRRSMNARVREGLIPGKVNYGHRGIRETLPNGLTRFKPGVREIDPEQARIVVRIFEEYASGKSPRGIAADLTREGVTSPAGTKIWNPGKLVSGGDGGMIGNQIYIGKLIWNTHTHVKNPDTGKNHQRLAKPEDRIVVEVPHLRILPQALWDRAQALRAERSIAKFGASRKRANNQKSADQHLLIGMLRCGACSGNMMIGQSNADGSSRVVCSYGHRRMGCEHHKSYDLKTLEVTVLAGVKARLTDPRAVIEYTKSYHARWTERQKQARTDRADVQKTLTRVTVQIDRIVTAISESDEPVKALMSKLRELEAQRAGLTEKVRLIEADTNIVELHPAAIKRFCDEMKKLHLALTGDTDIRTVAAFRSMFRNVFERVVIHPTAARQQYLVTPYARLSAITGFEPFPKVRTTKEMLAEQGVSTNRTSKPKGSLWGANSVIINLGKWQAA